MALTIEEPLRPRDAFGEDGERAEASRITLLLLLGLLYGDRRFTDIEDVMHAERRSALVDDALSFREAFPLPEPLTGARRDFVNHVRGFERRYDINPWRLRSQFEPERIEGTRRRRDAVGELVEKLYEKPDLETAADITLLALGDPDELTRVAGAISAADMFQDISLPVRALLFYLDDAQDERAAELAEIALHRLGGFAYMGSPPSIPPPEGPESKSAIIVHGSHFARVGTPIPTWWQPGGDFHDYIRTSFRPGLYSRPDFYTWSGGWSDHARTLAAKELVSWAHNRNLRGIDVLAHSHGGNVVMEATRLGLEVDQLVLMSCPVHWPRYQPVFSRVKSVESYQIRLDWVILVDGGGTYFNQPNIVDHILPQWFWRHNDTRDPAIWKKNGLSM